MNGTAASRLIFLYIHFFMRNIKETFIETLYNNFYSIHLYIFTICGIHNSVNLTPCEYCTYTHYNFISDNGVSNPCTRYNHISDNLSQSSGIFTNQNNVFCIWIIQEIGPFTHFVMSSDSDLNAHTALLF